MTHDHHGRRTGAVSLTRRFPTPVRTRRPADRRSTPFRGNGATGQPAGRRTALLACGLALPVLVGLYVAIAAYPVSPAAVEGQSLAPVVPVASVLVPALIALDGILILVLFARGGDGRAEPEPDPRPAAAPAEPDPRPAVVPTQLAAVRDIGNWLSPGLDDQPAPAA
jgi:hypothetical protein